MSVFTILMTLTLIGSLGFFALTLDRIIAYNKKYRFPELKYTKLFKIIRKEHVAAMHFAFVILHGIFTIWFIWTL